MPRSLISVPLTTGLLVGKNAEKNETKFNYQSVHIRTVVLAQNTQDNAGICNAQIANFLARLN